MKAPALVLSALLACLPLAAQADSDISKVNGSIRVETGESAGDVSTVNGSIHIEDDVRADDVETVNGSVTIGRNAVVGSIDTVNGRISLDEGARASSVETVNGKLTLAENAQVSGGLSAVNGSVRAGRNVSVAGDVTNVNGDIELDHARIGGWLRTTNGDIEVGAGSHVKGGIEVREKRGFNWFFWRTERLPEIIIGPGATVEGALEFERDVELYVSDRARIGPVTGATPIPFSGSEPGRAAREAAEQQVER